MHKITDESKEKVRKLAAAGVRFEDIAAKLGISSDTLTRRYRQELDDGRIDANAAIGETLYQQAKNGNTAAMIFWLKTQGGWREKNHVEVTGENGGPVKVDTSIFNAIITNLEAKRQIETNE